jgi:hypothetical protein
VCVCVAGEQEVGLVMSDERDQHNFTLAVDNDENCSQCSLLQWLSSTKSPQRRNYQILNDCS